MTAIPTDSPKSPRWAWLFAAGPVIWSIYFWMEARAEAIGCSIQALPLILWTTLGVAGSLMVTLSYNASRAGHGGRHRRHSDTMVMRDGFLLGAGLLVAALVVGLPTLVSRPC